jgi:asparagine synthase (glutamine-hydrolysing)
MRGLCGWFGPGPGEPPEAVLARMQRVAPGGTARTLALPGIGLGTQGDAAPPRWRHEDGFVIAVAGHPRWRGEAPSAEAPRADDLAALAHALRLRGAQAFSHLGGDFALAAWDERTRRGWLAVDRIGVHALVYGRAGANLVFASTLDALAGFPGIDRTLSRQGLFDYLYFHVCPGPGTIFEGLKRLPAGHAIEFGPNGADEPRPWWTMRFEEDHHAALESQEARFLDLTRAAVAEAAEGVATGAFLSGGTDSSTVSGMLGKVQPRPARAFSIGFDAEGFDEMAYARIAAKHFGCEHHEYYVTPADVVDAVPRIAAAYDQPFGNASAIPTYFCARMAREHGIERLLAGDGGDELWGGNERYGKQYLFGLYHRLPAALRTAVIEPLLMGTPGLARVPPLRKLRRYVEQARPPMPQRYQSYNLLDYLGRQSVLAPEFLAAVDGEHPLAMMIATHAPHRQASLVNQMLAIDLRFILADGDLPKVTRMCELAGVDVAFPLLDDRLIELSGTLRADLKLRRTQLRWFFKHALRDFLPPAVITKHKHGFGLPVGAWIVGHGPLHKLAVDSIALLRGRGIVRSEFVDDLFKHRLKEHAGYFGTMVWILMMLGLWLDSRRL